MVASPGSGLAWAAGSERRREFQTVSRPVQLVGMILMGLIGVLFLADLAVAVPFRRVNPMLDVAMAVASVIVTYLLWSLGPKRR